MRVASTEVPTSAAARLALRLHQAGETDLAQRVGIAVDTGHDVAFTNPERSTVLRVLREFARTDECSQRRKKKAATPNVGSLALAYCGQHGRLVAAATVIARV